MWLTGDCVNRRAGPDSEAVICLSLKDGGMFTTPGQVLE